MKKFSVMVIAATMAAAFSLTACGGNASSGQAASTASKTESAAFCSLDITFEYTANNQDSTGDITVQLDGKELWTLKKGELKQSIESVSAGNQTLTVLSADGTKVGGETTLNISKSMKTKYMYDNNKVSMVASNADGSAADAAIDDVLGASSVE